MGIIDKIKKGLLTVNFCFRDNRVFCCIREGLVTIIPVTLIGAFALVIRELPVELFHRFLLEFADGFLYMLLDFLYQASFGIVSVFLVLGISYSYGRRWLEKQSHLPALMFSAMFSFFLFSGILSSQDLSYLGGQGMFTAIFCGVTASMLFCEIDRYSKVKVELYSVGADEPFQEVLYVLIPITVTFLVFVFLHLAIVMGLKQDSFHALYVDLFTKIFSRFERNFGVSVLFIFMIHLLWFFGIHGSNALEYVNSNIFGDALDVNMQAIADGLPATEIFTRSFFDVFILMGGCGSTICLLFAILIFSQKRTTRELAGFAAFPALFNVNELLVFGLPIVFNPLYLVPFFLVPLMNLCISTITMEVGIVPIVTNEVSWTTPILIGGYYATGSIAGSILQFVNLVIGILIYAPFVRLADSQVIQDGEEKAKALAQILMKSEESRVPVELLKLRGIEGLTAMILAEDLRRKIDMEVPKLYYQPQVNEQGRCIGVEALLRWYHPVYGFLYPPMIIQLAEEMGRLTEYEENIFKSVIKDMADLLGIIGGDAKVSINVTGTTIHTEEYELFLKRMLQMYPQYVEHIMLEITEQAAFNIDEEFIARLTRIRQMGYRLAIDDFSMGNTSIKYLQSNVFTLIKLDGTLTRDILVNDRSKGIVSSVASLAREFDMQILAEYVETETQRKMLETMGCKLYQGYLFSAAVCLEKLEERVPEINAGSGTPS